MPPDADAVFDDFTLYANLPSTQQNKEGGTIVCKADDTSATLVGNLFHEVFYLFQYVVTSLVLLHLKQQL